MRAPAGRSNPGSPASAFVLALATAFAPTRARAEPPPCPSPAPGLVQISQRLVPDSQLAVGASGQALVKQAIAALCKQDQARAALKRTCASYSTGNVLKELRSRLVLDVATLGEGIGGASESIEPLAPYRLLSALLVAALYEPDELALASVLAASSSEGAWNVGCSPLPEAGPPRDAAPLRRAAHLVLRLGAKVPAPTDALRQEALDAIGALGRSPANGSLSPQQEVVLAKLVAEIERGRALASGSTTGTRGVSTRELAVSSFTSLQLALELLSEDASMPSAARLSDIVAAFVTGDLAEAAASQSATSGIPVTAEVLNTIERLVRLLRADSPEERERYIRRELLRLGPWPDGVLADLHVGAMVVNKDSYEVAGGALLGYSQDRWGAALRGAIDAYDLSNDDKIDTTRRYDGSLETWLAVKPSRRLSIEGRLALGLGSHDSTVTDGDAMLVEQSILGRGELSAGVRFQKPRYAVGFWAGGGMQYDSFQPTEMSGSTMTVTASNTLEGRATSRLRLQAQVLPDIVAVRVAADADYYRLTRATATTTMAGSLRVEESNSRLAHADVSGRLALDAEVARFFGFVPGIVGGVDVVHEESDSGGTTGVAPLIAAGIRRTTF